MTPTMTYEQLYNKMASNFIVERDDKEYNLGEFLLMKAQKRKENKLVAAEKASALPTTREHKASALSTIFSYVNDKITVKEAPIRDKTIRSFPIRASFSAFSSALVVCALAISCCILGVSAITASFDNIASTQEEIEENIKEETITLSAQSYFSEI